MRPIKLITESSSNFFINPLTIKDVESLMNSVILIRKISDIQNGLEPKIFKVGLFDEPINDSTTYRVLSNAIGLEALRNLCVKHKNIINIGSESVNSTYICFHVD